MLFLCPFPCTTAELGSCSKDHGPEKAEAFIVLSFTEKSAQLCPR